MSTQEPQATAQRSPREEWCLRRDQIILAIGATGVIATVGVSLLASIPQGNVPIVLAVLSGCLGLLGLPTFLRRDEANREKRESGS